MAMPSDEQQGFACGIRAQRKGLGRERTTGHCFLLISDNREGDSTTTVREETIVHDDEKLSIPCAPPHCYPMSTAYLASMA